MRVVGSTSPQAQPQARSRPCLRHRLVGQRPARFLQAITGRSGSVQPVLDLHMPSPLSHDDAMRSKCVLRVVSCRPAWITMISGRVPKEGSLRGLERVKIVLTRLREAHEITMLSGRVGLKHERHRFPKNRLKERRYLWDDREVRRIEQVFRSKRLPVRLTRTMRQCVSLIMTVPNSVPPETDDRERPGKAVERGGNEDPVEGGPHPAAPAPAIGLADDDVAHARLLEVFLCRCDECLVPLDRSVRARLSAPSRRR